MTNLALSKINRRIPRPMKRPLLCITLAAIAVAPVWAEGRAVELSPMIGVRNGANLTASAPGVPPAEADASMSFGLGVDVQLRPDGWFEAFYDHQSLSFAADPAAFGASRFDFDVDYLQFGGRYEPGRGRVHPFVAASLGITSYGASPGDVTDALAFSGSIGGGVRIPVASRVALRFELRGYGTFSHTAVAVSCGAGCLVEFGASGWYQLAARAGVSIRL